MKNIIKQQTMTILMKHTGLNASELHDETSFELINIHKNNWLELLYDVEDKFELEFPAIFWINGFAEQFKTVGNMMQIIEDLLQKKSKAA